MINVNYFSFILAEILQQTVQQTAHALQLQCRRGRNAAVNRMVNCAESIATRHKSRDAKCAQARVCVCSPKDLVSDPCRNHWKRCIGKSCLHRLSDYQIDRIKQIHPRKERCIVEKVEMYSTKLNNELNGNLEIESIINELNHKNEVTSSFVTPLCCLATPIRTHG